MSSRSEAWPVGFHPTGQRSEEHTSELQSRSDLVCRLLLEKKKREAYLLDRGVHSPVDVAAGLVAGAGASVSVAGEGARRGGDQRGPCRRVTVATAVREGCV